MTRRFVRASLALVFALSVAVVIVALWRGQRNDLQTWAATAGALAVVAAVLSSWSAQRVLEIQEDQLRPYPYPFIDSSSRYGFLQLRVTNFGGGTAHDIKLNFNDPLRNSRGEVITFKGGASGAEISVLIPGGSIATLIDGALQYFQAYKPEEADFSGEIEFKDAAGKRYSHPFKLNAGQFSGTLMHDEESLKTHFELQKIPDKLDAIEREMRNIREVLEPPETRS